ncbi:hypothetical protein C0J52_10385 [Blattella germanica]|nr:hypothetical protein C0J52_10385 [Blattella germanica]
MSDFENSPILEFSRSAKRCVIGYEALYRQTRLSFATHSCYSGPMIESYKMLDEHSSDADDESTDLSSEYLNSSAELFITPKNYFTCNDGNKPLSLILRRCDTPTSDRLPRRGTSFINEVSNGSSNDSAQLASKVTDEKSTEIRKFQERNETIELSTCKEKNKNCGQNITFSEEYARVVSGQKTVKSKLNATAKIFHYRGEDTQNNLASHVNENGLVCGVSDKNIDRDEDQYNHQFQKVTENALEEYQEEAGVSNCLVSSDEVRDFVSDKMLNGDDTRENENCANFPVGDEEYDNNMENNKERSSPVKTKNIADHFQISPSSTIRFTTEMIASKQERCIIKQNFSDSFVNGASKESNHENDCPDDKSPITDKLFINEETDSEDSEHESHISSNEVEKSLNDNDSEYEAEYELSFSVEIENPDDKANHVNSKVHKITSFSEKNNIKPGRESNSSQNPTEKLFSKINESDKLSRETVLPLEKTNDCSEVMESIPVEFGMHCRKSKEIISNGMDNDFTMTSSLNERNFTSLSTPQSMEFTQRTEVSCNPRKLTDIHMRSDYQTDVKISDKEMSLDNDVLSEAKNISALNNTDDTLSPVMTVPADHFASFEEIYDSLCQDNVSGNVVAKLTRDNPCDKASIDFSVTHMNVNNSIIALKKSDFHAHEFTKTKEKCDVTMLENDIALPRNSADVGKVEQTAFQKNENGTKLSTMINSDSIDFSSNFYDYKNLEGTEINNVALFETKTSPNPASLDKTEQTAAQTFHNETEMSLAGDVPEFTVSFFDDTENSKETENINIPMLESDATMPSSPAYLAEINGTALHTYSNEIKMPTTLDSPQKSYQTKISMSKCESRPSTDSIDDSESYIQGKVINSAKDSEPINTAGYILLNKHCEKSNVSNEDCTTRSSFSLSPKNPILTTGMDESENPAEIINDQYLPVNIETSSNIMENDGAEFIDTRSSSCLLNDLTASRASFFNMEDNSNQFSKQKEVHDNSFIAQTFTEDAMDCSYNEVPTDAAYLQHSPLLFSSDDENSCYTDTRNKDQEKVEDIKISDPYNNILTKEEEKLHRLQESLMGVLPPPSVTIPQISVSEMLKLLTENEGLIVSRNYEIKIGTEESKPHKIPLATSSYDQANNTSWPESKSCCYYDIQYNHGRASEEFESLCQKLRERYVGCETTSSCNIWFSDDISNKINSMTNKRRSTGYSPGRRLSHLARRRQTFSSANLLNNTASKLPSSQISNAAEKRLIMMDAKKSDRRQKSKGTRPQKPVPFVDNSKLQQTKRALFKSPPSGQKRVPSASKSRSASKKDKNNVDLQRIQNSRRALWPSTSNESTTSRVGHDRALTNISGHINVYGKRKRGDDSVELKNNKCSRRLFDDASVKEKTDFTHTDVKASDKSQILRNGENDAHVSSHTRSSQNKISGLSEHHRKVRIEGLSKHSIKK